MSFNAESYHTLIQERYNIIQSQLSHNEYYKQLYHITSPKLQHLSHSKPYIHQPTKNLPINTYIDHTVLKADATYRDIEQMCNQARQYNFYSVCVNSSRVTQCKKLLNGCPTSITCVVGFPLGSMSSDSKSFEAKQCIADGANEIDMVINIGYVKDNDYNYVFNDIVNVVRTASGYTVKVIIETSLLSLEQIIDCSILVVLSGAQYVKTSTGFNGGGATTEHISLMKLITTNTIMIKASGGIRDYTTAVNMLNCGANRLGVSAGVDIVQGEQQAAAAQQPMVQHTQPLPTGASNAY